MKKLIRVLLTNRSARTARAAKQAAVATTETMPWEGAPMPKKTAA